MSLFLRRLRCLTCNTMIERQAGQPIQTCKCADDSWCGFDDDPEIVHGLLACFATWVVHSDMLNDSKFQELIN